MQKLSRAAQLKLLEKYSPVVRGIAGGFRRKLPRNIQHDDLVAAGMRGLWDAIRRHPNGPTETFEWYVRVRIRGAIRDELRTQDWLPRRARARANAESDASGAYVSPPTILRIEDVSEWEQARFMLSAARSAEVAVEELERHDELVATVAQLPSRERLIITEHYFHGVKMKDLATKLGVSEPRISQLHTKALTTMRTLARPKA